MKIWVEIPKVWETKIHNRDPLGTEPRQNFMFEGPDLKVRDEYHSMDELYDHRMTLFCALLRVWNEWSGQYSEEDDIPVWKSKLHSDGTMFGPEWFIAGIGRQKGKQITYHLKVDPYWDQLENIQELERAPEWDGHNSNDVLERLRKL